MQLVDGVQSIYRWEGRIDESPEVQLIAKTTPAAAPALIDRLRALHPYQVPEILTLEARSQRRLRRVDGRGNAATHVTSDSKLQTAERHGV